jgi:hypothetical protein
MPLRMVLTLLGLFGGCLAMALLAWASGSEIYILIPSRRYICMPPPTHPSVVLGLLVACLVLYFYLPRYGLLLFTALLGGLLLGSVVGYGVFAWIPTIPQVLLTLAMIAESAYGWTVQDYYLDD